MCESRHCCFPRGLKEESAYVPCKMAWFGCERVAPRHGCEREHGSCSGWLCGVGYWQTVAGYGGACGLKLRCPGSDCEPFLACPETQRRSCTCNFSGG
jgi:hypothetical protein